MIYCDTSYIVRLYLDDSGYHAVRELCCSQIIASAEHALAEVPAALHRARREQRLSDHEFEVQIIQFKTDCAAGGFLWQPLTSNLFTNMSEYFAQLPPTTFLRAADALHLACAVEHGFTSVYSNDRHFLAAAPLFGLEPRNVITP